METHTGILVNMAQQLRLPQNPQGVTGNEEVFMRQHKIISSSLRETEQEVKIFFSNICMEDVSFRCSVRFSVDDSVEDFKRAFSV